MLPVCPYCRKPFPADSELVRRFRPFCSERCKLADLGAWTSGAYSIPVVDLDDVELEEAAAETDAPGDED